MSDFVPSDVDKAFIRNIMLGLSVNGVWAYKSLPLVWQKRSERILALVASYDLPGIEEQIHRTKMTLEAAGYIFEDGRTKP